MRSGFYGEGLHGESSPGRVEGMKKSSNSPALSAGNRAAFLVPGVFYAVLAIATFYAAVYLLWPAIGFAKGHYVPGVETSRENVEVLKGMMALPLKLLMVVVFYSALAGMILYRRGRSLAIIGAIFSVPTVGGTIPGLLFLFWTLRYWPKAGETRNAEGIRTRNAEVGTRR